MTKFLLSASVIIFYSHLGQAALPQDEEKERQFHDLYLQYYQDPTPSSAWNKAVDSASKKEYRVVNGDTLWGISDTFFADAFFWPKLWAVNVDQIGSPHEISTGQTIVFVAGTESTPPSLAVSGTENTKDAPRVVDLDAPEQMRESTADWEYTLPPARFHSKPLREIPQSLPGWKYPSDAIQDKFSVSGKVRGELPADEVLPIFVADEEMGTVGTVIGIERGGKTSTDGQIVLVKFHQTPEQKIYHVTSAGEAISDPYLHRKGLLIETQGEIQLQESVNKSENIYRALVTKSIGAVKIGGVILPEAATRIPKLNPDGPTSSVPAFIITGPFTTERKFFDGTSPVVLNRGTEDGLQVDQVLNVYRNHILQDSKQNIRENPKKLGTLQIVQASGKFSTAVFITIDDAIRRGDVTSAELAVDKSQTSVE